VNRDLAAGLARLADDPLPRQLVGRLADLQRGPGDAPAAGDAGQLGDLTVGRDAAARDLADDGIDPPVERTNVRRQVVILHLAGCTLAWHAANSIA